MGDNTPFYHARWCALLASESRDCDCGIERTRAKLAALTTRSAALEADKAELTRKLDEATQARVFTDGDTGTR